MKLPSSFFKLTSVKGHNHATQATKILNGANNHTPEILLAASSSHALAATSFASAAKTTRDPESHRTLEILVQQHERYATRLKALAEKPDSQPPSPDTAEEPEKTSVEGTANERRSRSPPPAPPLPLVKTSGAAPYPARLQKSTSSLATNLASARGIPPSSGPPPDSRRRRPPPLAPPTDSKPTTNPLSLLPPDAPGSPHTPQEEPFSKFYSSLNTLIHRIGSPFTASLAFAGLQVGETSTDNEISTSILPTGWTQGRGRGRNLGLDETAGGESFYVVPTSGGTISYADILHHNAPPRKPRSLLSTVETTDRKDELAKFTGHNKTLEELQLENATLRRSLEQATREKQKLERRSRENENMLKSSVIALSRNSGPAGMQMLNRQHDQSWLHTVHDDGEEVYSEGRHVGQLELIREERDLDSEARIAALEAEVREVKAKAERTARENEKLKKQVLRDREKWESLRDNARKRGSRVAGGEATRGDE